MEPTPRLPPVVPMPKGPWWWRGIQALWREGRLPTRWSRVWDRWASRCGWSKKTVRVGDLRIRCRRLATDVYYVRDVMVGGEYFAPGYEISATDTVIDVGANIGCFALAAGRLARQGRVLAFEPTADNHGLLVENILLNQLDHVSAFAAAVIGEPESATADEAAKGRRQVIMQRHATNTGGHQVTFSPAEVAECEQVPATTLADIFRAERIDRCQFLKLDCEGSEYGILRTLPDVVWSAIDRMVLEYHVAANRSKRECGDELVAQLERHGFIVDTYTDDIGTPLGLIRARRPPG